MTTAQKQTQSAVKYPDIKVELIGADGNAFAIIGKVSGALRKAKISSEEVKAFQDEVVSGDYDNLLVTCMRWVTVS
jgi:hypothetical protein